MAMAEFHKDMAEEGPYYGVSILRTDIIHVVDALRDLCGDVTEVAAHVDHQYVRWEGSYNLFNALLRFENGASGILTANRTSGNRYERFEYHGRNVSTYIRAPEQAEIYRKGQRSGDRDRRGPDRQRRLPRHLRLSGGDPALHRLPARGSPPPHAFRRCREDDGVGRSNRGVWEVNNRASGITDNRPRRHLHEW